MIRMQSAYRRFTSSWRFSWPESYFRAFRTLRQTRSAPLKPICRSLSRVGACGRRHAAPQLSRWRTLQNQHVPARRSAAQQVGIRGLCGVRLRCDPRCVGRRAGGPPRPPSKQAATSVTAPNTTPWGLRCRTIWSRRRKSIKCCNIPCGRVSAWRCLTRPAGSHPRNSSSRPSTDGWRWSWRPTTCGSDLIVIGWPDVGGTRADLLSPD